ncbi:MAG: radical SAM protein [Deltaproteobacteria bacterium]|nr:radical SAM protein [Deltaproteobacteria bacterium]
MLFADEQGQIFDHPDLLLLCRRGRELALPRPDELIPLPEESTLYLLPCRSPMGLNPETGTIERLDDVQGVAAFVSPAHTISGVAAYDTRPGAPILPMFSFGAVGFARDKFWVAATKVDQDPRQIFTGIPQGRIDQGVADMLARLPGNRLAAHLGHCALSYCCPAAKNLALGRFEAPLPTAQSCNARCVGCISLQPKASCLTAPQHRIAFTPTAAEIVEVMNFHAERAANPIFSFGQGCEGEPLTEADLIAEAVAVFRKGSGPGTVNINTNGSRPNAIPILSKAGLSSIRVSMNSADPARYVAYHRPVDYTFDDVRHTVLEAKAQGLFVSLNLLCFPGVTDTEGELEALSAFLAETRTDFVQMRNLSLDPDRYMDLAETWDLGPAMGLGNFLRRLRKAAPWMGVGYFNPAMDGTVGT